MKPQVLCKYRVDIEEKIFCKKHQRFVQHPYQCSRSECPDCSFPTLAVVSINIGRCDECPFHDIDRTMRAGYAFDYFCKAMNRRKITGYVEYDSEIPPVPGWCPFRLEKNDDKTMD